MSPHNHYCSVSSNLHIRSNRSLVNRGVSNTVNSCKHFDFLKPVPSEGTIQSAVGVKACNEGGYVFRRYWAARSANHDLLIGIDRHAGGFFIRAEVEKAHAIVAE